MSTIPKNTGERRPPTVKEAKGPVRFARDAKTGRYVALDSHGENRLVAPAPQESLKHPADFVEEFTKSPVVDNVMRRLSR